MTGRTQTTQSYRERVNRVLVHIEEDLSGDLSLAALARVGCFSPHHFHRVFRAIVGEPLHRHVRRLRLERAARLLRRSDRSLGAIARLSGFATHESFSRAFRSLHGCAPSELRERPSSAVAIQPARSTELRTLEDRSIAFLRHIGSYDDVGSTVVRLVEWARTQDLLDETVQILGIGYDDPAVTATELLRFDAAITLPRRIEPRAEIGVRVLPGGLHFVADHVGPYRELPVVLEALYGHLARRGLEAADSPTLLVYRNDPRSAKGPPEVEIQIPVEPTT